MNDHGFAKGALLQAWDRARSDAFSEMTNVVSASNDTLQAIIAPDRDAAEWLCREELSVWCHDKAMLRADILFWGGVFVFSIAFLLGNVLGQLHVSSPLVTFVLALLCLPPALSAFVAATFVTDSARRFHKLHTRGYARGALGILTNSGYSMWGFGRSRLYVVHNTREANSVPVVGFYGYDELGTPLINRTSDEIAVELYSRAGSLIRVMILPKGLTDQVHQLVDLLEKNISDHGHTSLMHSSAASR
jgi:hypothetical protein